MSIKEELNRSQLGKNIEYCPFYDPSKLFLVSRKPQRDELGFSSEKMPFHGFDIWNHFEVSWLNEKGKPLSAYAKVAYSADSTFLIESKSLKLYFHSFNNTKFQDENSVKEIIQRDLEKVMNCPVYVEIKLFPHYEPNFKPMPELGICLDHLDVTCDSYHVNPQYLTTESEVIAESLHSHLLKSNCLLTQQPDWGSLYIDYRGKKINHEGLLKYIVSFRDHNEFHEHCIERIFIDIWMRCQPEELTVFGKYTRRGGIDINPYRTSVMIKSYSEIKDFRTVRQ